MVRWSQQNSNYLSTNVYVSSFFSSLRGPLAETAWEGMTIFSPWSVSYYHSWGRYVCWNDAVHNGRSLLGDLLHLSGSWSRDFGPELRQGYHTKALSPPHSPTYTILKCTKWRINCLKTQAYDRGTSHTKLQNFNSLSQSFITKMYASSDNALSSWASYCFWFFFISHSNYHCQHSPWLFWAPLSEFTQHLQIFFFT